MTKLEMPPEHAIWKVPELLGQIISYLPARDILTQAQGVSKFWKGVIDSSPIIQTRLWRKPESSHMVSPSSFSTGSRKHHWLVGGARSSRALPMYSGPLALNTLFLFSRGARPWKYDMLGLGTNTSPPVKVARTSSGRVVELKFLHSDSKQRKGVEHLAGADMYLSEPPVTVVQMHIDRTEWCQHTTGGLYPIHHYGDRINASVRVETGVTVGMVREVAAKMAALLPRVTDGRHRTVILTTVELIAENISDEQEFHDPLAVRWY